MRVTEGLLAVEQRAGALRLFALIARHVRQFFQLELRGFQPFFIRFGGGQLALDLFVLDNTALFEIDEQHFAGL